MPDAPAAVTASIPVGVEVESRPGTTRWAARVWRPVALRPGRPGIPDWTVLPSADDDGVFRYYAGTTRLVVRSTETGRYRDNIGARVPAVYTVLRRAAGPTGWTLLLATVDPSEAHAHADVGEDLVEALPMPPTLREWLAAFVDRHHVERARWKRQRDDKVPERTPAPADRGRESFLDRWSRGKQEARAERAEPPAAPAPVGAPAPLQAPPPDLPTVGDIRTRRDVAEFMREEVPAELRRAALRRAWSLDPAIAGHKPLVDYDWNVNAPGYGRLRAADDPGQLIESLFGHLRKATETASPEGSAEVAAPPPEPEAGAVAAGDEVPSSKKEHPPGRRRHGGATPGREA